MRIIGGKYGGLRLHPPTNLPVRPTTDIAKEALFNILENRLSFSDCHCLDLFTGTGNISFELASRGVTAVDAVDVHYKCLQYIKETTLRLKTDVISTKKADVLKFLTNCEKQYDFIFADPPYDLPQLPQLATLIFTNGLLKPNGLLVIEHPSTRKIEESTGYMETRKYGYSSFSFYLHTENNKL
ncbi:16S rRNA (guanine(966)-N(2))-methyltransferase RsmD [Sphingobacterium griseoflavum]|uniref:Methyltransferase n=1 Tax=Sphingobacterium griseoflavum TaxID=1474952 RepID=A0ABQ3HYY1_9SPHI|nr:16S rRNA (guanine(966)-N(2))-methyltransferase RsmD [Sphingobacterium griseoflavum]GHE41700.1 methyltransferase [Sphingobacterium griseoflavum]